MKKIVLVLALVLSLALVACGEKEDSKVEDQLETTVNGQGAKEDELENDSEQEAQVEEDQTEGQEKEDETKENTESANNQEQEKVMAPDFTTVDLDGNEVSLSDYRGKVVFLNFWATWCEWCEKEMPDMDEVYQEFKDKDVAMLAIDVGESKEEVEKWMDEKGFDFSFDILLDKNQEIAKQYYITAFPTTIIIDKEGYVYAGGQGALTKEIMTEALNAALEGRELNNE